MAYNCYDKYDIDKVNTLYKEGVDEDGNYDFKFNDKLFKKYQEKTNQVISNIKEIGLPEKGQQLRIITLKSFNSVAIITHIAKFEIIEDALFVIFAINQSAAKSLIKLYLEKKLINVKLIISDIRNAGIKDKAASIKLLEDYFDITYIKSHAKISVLKTNKDNHYVIEGSGNFSYNSRLEQYIIDNDKRLYDFSKEWVEEIKNII